MSLMSMFPGGGGTNNQPLKAPSNFVVSAGGQTSLHLTWTDPENEYSQPSGALIGEWMFTRIVRKTGSPPVNANDGVLVVESGIKNQYQTTPYIDSGLIQGTTYYYAAFAFTKTRVSSPGAFSEYELKGYDAVFGNNTWDVIHLACQEGVASELWNKGDSKDETVAGINMSFEIVAFNDQTALPLTEGGYPLMVLSTKFLPYIGVLGYKRPSTTYGKYSYNGSTLQSKINSYYNSMPASLKQYVQQCHFVNNREYMYTVDGSYDNNKAEYNAYAIPLSGLLVNNFYPSQSSRIKRYLNSDGDPNAWALIDQHLYRRGSSNNVGPGYVDDTGTVYTSGSFFPSGGYGAMFCFGFGKAGA